MACWRFQVPAQLLGHVVAASILKSRAGPIKYKLGVVPASWHIASVALNWASFGTLWTKYRCILCLIECRVNKTPSAKFISIDSSQIAPGMTLTYSDVHCCKAFWQNAQWVVMRSACFHALFSRLRQPISAGPRETGLVCQLSYIWMSMWGLCNENDTSVTT